MSVASIARGYADVRARVARAAERAGRDPADVRIVAAGKYATAADVLDAAKAGVTDVGENRAQDLRDKYGVVGDAVTWHFLGSVQTNKVRYLDVVHLVHSLDRMEEAEALQARGEARGRTWDVLVELNVAGEPSKQGIRAEDAERLLRDIAALSLVRARGVMTVAPAAADPEDVRWVFAETRRLRDRLRDVVDGLEELSMGMTDDFEVAVEEGATIVRVGRAIFAPDAPQSQARTDSAEVQEAGTQ